MCVPALWEIPGREALLRAPLNSPKKTGWSPNSHCVGMGPYLGSGSLQRSVKRRSCGWAPLPRDRGCHKKQTLGRGDRRTRGGECEETRGQTAVPEPWREPWPGPALLPLRECGAASTLVWDPGLQGCGMYSCCFFRLPHLWRLVVAARGSSFGWRWSVYDKLTIQSPHLAHWSGALGRFRV